MNGSVAPRNIEQDGRESRGRSRLGRNVFVMIVTFVGNYLASFATFPYLTRVLGPTHFGILAYAMAIAAYGTLFTEWGFNLSGPKAVVDCRDHPCALNELIWSIAGAKVGLCLMSFVALLALMHFDRHLASSRAVVLLSWLAVIANVFTLYWLFQGLERFYVIAVMVFANRLVTLPLTFLLVHGPDDVAIAATIQAAGPAVGAFLSIGVAWRLGLLKRPDLCWRSICHRLAHGADMFVATASVTLFGAANAIILASLAGPYQVGIYAAADKIKTVGNLVPAQISAVLYPRISRLFKEHKRAAAKLTVIGAIATVVTSIGSVGVFFLLSGPLTRLILGNDFHGASSVLLVLCFSTLFGNLAYFLGLQVLVPFGQSRKRSLVMLSAGCLNIVLAFRFIPGAGAQGAATSFLIAEALILVVYVILIVREPQLRTYFSLLMKR
ncbi:flippase [Paraburkholderia sp. BCC1885]|uniref:flippase n=1 Tax=Paraburkholderia sp. BCC1885 TaxID=2562669 RepID=UPI001183BF1B|nr:flippase [Paraburkholderia sp. BCC1885]